MSMRPQVPVLSSAYDADLVVLRDDYSVAAAFVRGRQCWGEQA